MSRPLGAATKPPASREVDAFLEMRAAERGAAANTIASYRADLDDFAGFREVRAEVLGANRPASTLVVVKALVFPELRVEIECVAAKA